MAGRDEGAAPALPQLPQLPAGGGAGGGAGGAAKPSRARAAAEAIFKLIDADDSELIDTEEIAEAIAETECAISGEELEKMVEQIDDDDSGAIDIGEFVEWWEAPFSTLSIC